MKSEKKKILSGKECEVMNYLPYFKEPPIDVNIKQKLCQYLWKNFLYYLLQKIFVIIISVQIANFFNLNFGIV